MLIPYPAHGRHFWCFGVHGRELGGVGALDRGGSASWQDVAQGVAAHDVGDCLALPERGQVAQRPGRAWPVVSAKSQGDLRAAAQLFIRWAKLGVWERLLERAQQGGIELGMVFIDGTSVRAHHKAAGAEKGVNSAERDMCEALGRSRGIYGTKACVIADGHGRAVAFALAPGQAHEVPLAPDLVDSCRACRAGWLATGGYASDGLRALVWDIGVRSAIPSRRTDAPVACPPWIYNNRHLVENLWARLKEWRAVATRHEKTARSFMGILCLAATTDWIKL